MPSKKIVAPFSLFKRAAYNRWIIKFQGKQYKTGLEATASNRNAAEEIGWRIYYDWIKRNEISRDYRGKKRLPTFQECFDAFLETHALNATVKTKEAYNRAFHLILDDKASRHKQISEVTILFHVRSATLRNRQIKNGWDVYRRAFTTFLNWCVKEKHIDAVPDIAHFFPKPTPKKIQVYTKEEFSAIYNYFLKRDKEIAILILLLASTGLRIHEALLLNRSDIENNTIHVISKDGKRAETAVISDELLAAIRSLPQRKDKKVFRWQLVSVSRLRKTLYAAMDDLGINRNGRSFHELRKTFISLMANSDIDVRTASRLARCDVKVMMKHYTVLTTETTQAAADSVAKKLHTIINTVTE